MLFFSLHSLLFRAELQSQLWSVSLCDRIQAFSMQMCKVYFDKMLSPPTRVESYMQSLKESFDLGYEHLFDYLFSSSFYPFL